LLLLALMGVGAFQATGISAADDPTVEPAETPNGYVWKPAAVNTALGASVAFRNPGNVVPHGVHWTGGPEKPSCSGVPVDDFGPSWSGACTFAQAGTYTFVCTVHPEEMRGTITVSSGETTPPPSGSGPEAPPTAEGAAVEALRLPRNQRRAAVRGSTAISPSAVGGSLIVELEAKRASLGERGTGTSRVGKLTRSLASAGRVRFAVPLKSVARRALQHARRLSLTVKIVVIPPDGSATTLKRRVELHE
jgi:plastocyanin